VSLLLVPLVSLAAVGVLMAVTALVSRRVGRVAVVDVAWGLGFVLVAGVSAALGDEPIRWLLLTMVGVWGLRLAWHIGKRQLAHPEEDPRYAKMLGDGGFGAAVRRVFLVQGLAMWFVSLPVQVAAGSGTR
jgi:steroid 5-alpha reductase family enzyme